MPNRWKPNVTVAAVIERDGRYLLVEEQTSEGLRLNNPAGHLDPGESLAQACVRETLEETAHDFTPTALVGVYLTGPGPSGPVAGSSPRVRRT
jgi:ADP-ribose pyrophosphatase YjhB (NUDIX family)